MSIRKLENIKAEGRMPYLTYIADRGGVGHIRAIIPDLVMGSWRYKKMSFDPIHMSNFIMDPNWYKGVAFVKFQRSATKEHVEMFKYFATKIRKQTNSPIIYEIDDLLFDIPKSNFASKYYSEREEYIKEMMSIADGITVSTKPLKDTYWEYNKNISIVPNRLAKFLWGEVKVCKPKEREKPRIVYPASQNHFSIKGMTEKGGDIKDTLLEFIKKTKKDKYEWIFIGGLPEELEGDKDITFYPWLDYVSFPKFMKNLDVDIGIAPLDINKFNECKSNLKFLEYITCGIPAVYTNIYPYKDAKCKTDTEEQMTAKIEELCSDIDKRYDVWYSDYNKVKKDLFLEENRKKWLNENLWLFGKRIL